MSARRIGIAGYMGSGKSLAAKTLARRGALLIEADVEAKKVMNESEDIRRRLLDAFGPTVVRGETVDSAALGAIVFAGEGPLSTLNGIVHPAFLQHIELLLTAPTERDVILDAALLPTWGREELFDTLIWVRAPLALRLDRLCLRTGLERGEIERRVELQQRMLHEPESHRWRKVENDGDAQKFCAAVLELVTEGA